jgi:hypothetical protein
MKPLPKKQAHLVECLVSGLFSDMCNEKNRGPKFSWCRFPEMAAGHVIGNWGLYQPLPNERRRMEIEVWTRRIAADMVTRSGFCPHEYPEQ